MLVVDLLLGVTDRTLAVVVGGVCLLALPAELLLNGALAHLNNHSKDGHAKDHAGDLEETAHDGNGDQHRQGADARVVALDEGNQDVTVQLLDDEDDEDEPDELFGVGHEDDETRGYGTDQGAEDGDDVGDGADGGDEEVVLRHAADGQDDEHGDTHGQSVHKDSLEVAAEGLVHQGDDLGDLAILLLAQMCGAELGQLGHPLLLGGEDVEGDEETQHRVDHRAEDAGEEAPDVADQIGVKDEVLQLVQHLTHENLGITEDLVDEGVELLHVRDIHVQLHLVDGGLDQSQEAVEVALVIGDQILDGLVQLGDDHGHQDCQDGEGGEEGAEQGDAQAEIALALELAEDEILVEFQNGVEQVGDDAPNEQGGEDVADALRRGEEGGQTVSVDDAVGGDKDQGQDAEKDPALLQTAPGAGFLAFPDIIGIGMVLMHDGLPPGEKTVPNEMGGGHNRHPTKAECPCLAGVRTPYRHRRWRADRYRRGLWAHPRAWFAVPDGSEARCGACPGEA